MARAESQGLQVVLIVFVILTIILSVTTFVFFKNGEEAVARSEADRKAANDASAARSAAENNVEWLKQKIGLEHDAAKAAGSTLPATGIQKVIDEDMKNVLANFPRARQTYRDAISALLEGFAAVHAQAEENRAQLTVLKDKVELIQRQKEKTHRVELARAADAQKQLNVRTAEFSKKDRQSTKEKEVLTKAKNELAADLEEVEKAKEKAVRERDKEIASDEQIIRALSGINDQLRAETFEVANGEIVWVNQSGGTAWINLGKADSLPQQINFSVWGHDENDVARGRSKAKIEVVKVLDEHLAEARIVDDLLADPILRGDKIFTPLWSPGRQVRFALAGFMDINGDGESDRKTIKDLIALSGGLLDAELEGAKITDGKGGQGRLTIDTRYLVLGKEPKEQNVKWSDLLKEADRLGVKKISLEKFLDLVGFKQEAKAVRFGRYADPIDFKVSISGGERRQSAGVSSSLFPKRGPKSRQRGLVY